MGRSELRRRAVAEIVAREGGVDILVINAGLQFIAPIDEYPEERWEQLLRVMLFGPFYLTKDVLPVMRRGRILPRSCTKG